MRRRDVSAKNLAAVAAPGGAVVALSRDNVKQRPFWRVLVSSNHKDIGTLYSLLAFIGGCVGGVLSMQVGRQLMGSSHGFIASFNAWDAVITAHGLVMIFWFVMPALMGGMGNWFVPLMLGAADTAFPRINLLSFWLLALGFAMMLLGLLSSSSFAPSFSLASMYLAGLSFLLSGSNFIVTILNMRAVGLSLHKMPLFCWSILVASGLVLMVVPVLAGAVTLLLAGHGVSPSVATGAVVPFEHLFWFFGHPEAYIIVLPAFGVVSQIVSTFTGKPIKGASVVAYSMVAIALVGFVVWAHRLFFPAGIDHYMSAVALVLAVPGAVPFIAWGLTLYKANISYKTPMLWALGFMFLFVAGGLMGIVMALTRTHNAYALVVHLHYVLSMGTAFAIFAGFYYWIGKVSGRPYPEVWGKVHFWTFFLGVNLTFFPMQFPHYHAWAMISTCGALLSGLSALAFFYVLFRVFVSEQKLSGNYWGDAAATLEWAVASPPPTQSSEGLSSVL